MMTLGVLTAINEEIATEAAQAGRIPYVPWNCEEVDRWQTFPLPNLGYHVPDGWEKTDQEWFVDKSGWGASWEPALTVKEFQRQLSQYVADYPDHGYAISEEGEFQLYVSAYQRTDP